MNIGDEGQALPVLVGYDGQEICEEAGAGVVDILRDKERREE